jgi:hypothetical protein
VYVLENMMKACGVPLFNECGAFRRYVARGQLSVKDADGLRLLSTLERVLQASSIFSAHVGIHDQQV